MIQDKLNEILKSHKKWLQNQDEGQRANLREANLKRADLRGADLEKADLRGSSLRGADLGEAHLRGAKGIYCFVGIGIERRAGYAVKHETTVMYRLGCHWGSFKDTVIAVRQKYGYNSLYEKQIILAMKILRSQK